MKKKFFAVLLLIATVSIANPFLPILTGNVAAGGGGGGGGFPSGAVAYWPLGDDNVWADTVGSEALTENGTVTTTAGQQGNDANFVPANTPYLSHADDATLSLPSGTSWTFVASVKPHITSGTMPILQKGYEVYAEVYLSADYSNDKFTVIMKDLGTPAVSTTDTGILVQDAWYLVIAWYDSGADTLNIQASNLTTQGSPSSGSAGGGNASTPGEFRIGLGPGSTYADGVIGDVALFKRTLTSQERTDIWTLWKAGTSGP